MRKTALLTIIFFVAVFALIGFGAATVLAQGNGIPGDCEYTNGAYYQAGLFPRYEVHNQRVVLVSWHTGEVVQEIETSLVVDGFQVINWSPDCRYLAAALGSAASMDTVVWDVTANNRIGVVPDAHEQPHHVTWGPGDYLVVETRNGAILWNIPANTQTILTTSFNTFTARNFSRLRWDAENNQLIANLAVGGRVIYDMNTGQELPEAANTTSSSSVSNDTNQGSIFIAGRDYSCQGSYSYGYRNWFSASGPLGIFARYNTSNGMIYLALDDHRRPDEVLQVVEDSVDASWFRFRSWSPDCRYFAASLGIPGQDASDTAVWDIIENRRVGTFEDAQNIMHPIHWSPTGDALVVETRNGGYLWYLSTDTRTLINPEVETALAGSRSVHNFHRIGWDAARGQLLVVQVGSGNTVTAYDIQTGQQIGVYASGNNDAPVHYGLSPDDTRIVVYSGSAITVWDRDTGAGLVLNPGEHDLVNEYGSSVAISPDNRYLAVDAGRELVVWDLWSLTFDATPNAIYETRLYDIYFVDNTTLASSSSVVRFNITTGELNDPRQAQQTLLPTVPIDGESGTRDFQSWYRRRHIVSCNDTFVRYERETRQLTVVNRQTRETIWVLADDLNALSHSSRSPNCRYLFTEVGIVNDADVPYDNAPLDDIYRDRLSSIVIFWDAITGERLQEIPHPHRFGTGPAVIWSPEGDRALVHTSQGYFLYHPASNQIVLLAPDRERSPYRSSDITSAPRVYWDYTRGQIIVSGWQAIYAFDMQTGVERYRFTSHPNRSGGGGFNVWNDNSTLLVAGFGSFGVWNLDSLEHVHVDIDSYGGAFLGSRVALSPDGRYLVMAKTTIRVWDLFNLPEEFNDRDPIYRHHGPQRWVHVVRFVDNNTIETEIYDGTVQRWDLHTGEEIPLE